MTNWSPEYETGHAQIDTEHREFFRQLNDLKIAIENGAGREKTVDLIKILQEYVLGHFSREEAYMKAVNCPALSVNCSAHGAFAKKLEDWLTILSLSGTPMSLVTDIHRESLAWIKGHIVGVDCKLRGCADKRMRDQAEPAPVITLPANPGILGVAQ